MVRQNDFANLVVRLELKFFAEGRGADQQFVQQDAQRIDVAAGVDVRVVDLRLFGTHVLRRADHGHRRVGHHRPAAFACAP